MLSAGDEGSKEEEKLGERKVYSRKSFKGLKNNKTSSNSARELPKAQAVVPEGLNSLKRLGNSSFDAGSDNFSVLNRDGLPGKGGVLRQEDMVSITLSMKSKSEALELRRKLEGERDMIRSLMRKIEANEGAKNARAAYGSSCGNKVTEGMGPVLTSKPMKQLNVSVFENSKGGSESVEKEKRTPKANQMYRNSEFLLAKDRFPPPENIKKLKSSGKKGGTSDPGNRSVVAKFPNQILKSCNVLLERLMKHKHGWVFNTPVDAAGLGLHDYFEIIKKPMDLGTVKTRLNQSWYKSPVEFAEDVRLTFQNAMTYNPKEQDVYVMAQQLSQLFEDKWTLIEADYKRELKLAVDFDVGYPIPTSRKAPQSKLAPDKKKTIDRSESMTKSVEPKRKLVNTAQSGKLTTPKKPKAKDPNKREMTYDEKQKLSINLQSLPSEKLENVVHIIRKRNPSVSQQDDEIEVDIDCVDTETLWELDRFITNYKKSLSKNKRQAESLNESIAGPEQNTQEKTPASVAAETLKESRKDEKRVATPTHLEDIGGIDKNQGAGSSSASSGSSSSESDGESSSRSDSGQSPTE
ncbi:hypothetical protein F511_04718 [Dorcoceras hygrometricum]|uniref:Transcription factor GTE4-like n=1 Tax=Dorcoceras hygrometricum TaxID=472368 RepID=A0A2Z7AZK6_9LAMI|nr:hypothetical protein F511_04718 [Dorcoceras hygrometricum]